MEKSGHVKQEMAYNYSLLINELIINQMRLLLYWFYYVLYILAEELQ